MSIERKALNGFAWVVVLFLVAGAMSFFVLSQIDRMLKPHNLSADVSLHLNTLRLGQAVLFAFVLGVAYFKARQVGTGLRHASGQLEQLMAQLDQALIHNSEPTRH